MTNRSADATIKGYYYQFDTTILKLLELSSDTDSLIVEGIEDIDIITTTEFTTIQCKYLSKPKFINSAVREPIIYMLQNFIRYKSLVLNYVLYAHFEEEFPGKEPSINLAKLKEILTYKEDKVEKHYEIENNITDEQLESFLNKFKIIFGLEFNTQQKQVLAKLKARFNCTDFEADTIYYNNSLRVIIDKAINKSIKQREISKFEFLTAIDCQKRLFNYWYIKLRSKKAYLKLIAQNLKSTRVLEPCRAKMILLGQNILNANNSEMPLAIFIEALINRHYKLNSCLRDAKPFTIVLDCDKSSLVDYKKNLIDMGIMFNDGYEEIKFSPLMFNKEPILNKSPNGSKIHKSSYLVKLISKTSLLETQALINQPCALLVFSNEETSIKFNCVQFYDIKYCDNLKEVFKLLTP